MNDNSESGDSRRDFLAGRRESAHQRHQEKISQVLLWLLRWRFCSREIIGLLLGVRRAQVFATVRGLIHRGLIQELDAPGCPDKLLILTPPGATQALSLHDEYECSDRQPLVHLSRFSCHHPVHDLEAQKFVIAWLERNPGASYRTDLELRFLDMQFQDGFKFPDAVLYTNISEDVDKIDKMALEVQQSGAKPEYFERILGGYCSDLRDDRLDMVVFASTVSSIIDYIQDIAVGRCRPFQYLASEKKWRPVSGPDPVRSGYVTNCICFADLPYQGHFRPQLYKEGDS